MKRITFMFSIIAACLVFSSGAYCQEKTTWKIVSQPKKEFHIPDILDYQTLKCDLHMHTVFSDGQVWPNVRVNEAWREDLDAIAISDHIEYQPHKNDLPTNFNRSFEIAEPSAKEKGILFPRAAEITRDTPPGHFNAIFLNDIDPLDTEDFVDSIKAANQQGAFVWWNHQAWKGEEKGRWLDVHTKIYEEKLLHGMEVCNGGTYYPNAHKWCLEKGLTMMGNSDIHAPAMLMETTNENHRTVTLVFVTEKTLPALKEALFAGRTAVWYKNQIIGKERYLEAILANSVMVSEPYRKDGNTYWINLTNTSGIDFEFKRVGPHGPASFTLSGDSTMQLSLKVGENVTEVPLSYQVVNLLVAPGESLTVDYTLSLE